MTSFLPSGSGGDMTSFVCRQDLEEFEERTREETQQLVSMVTELQAESRRLQERREAERNGHSADQTGTPPGPQALLRAGSAAGRAFAGILGKPTTGGTCILYPIIGQHYINTG